jgi:hypothetical protein
MSPIGPYTDFDDCVAKNQDKTLPEGFCAFLEHKISGEWPGVKKSKLPDDLFKIYEEALVANKTEKEAWEAVGKAASAAGYDMARFGWVKQFKSPALKTIAGVKVFAAGTWTDSSGATREWGEKDLDAMVDAFKAEVPKVVPLKCGHTTDAFNKAIADALGVPLEIITGDNGQGQIGIGRMTSLERKGNLLIAAFENCPDAIAALIEGGQYSTVSVEIEDKVGDFGPVITGVALLGAEEPAVDKASLEGAKVFGGKREGARVLSFQASKDSLAGIPVDVLDQEFKTIKGDLDQAIGKTRGASFFRKLFEPISQWFEESVKGRRKLPDSMDNAAAGKVPPDNQGPNDKKGEDMDIKKLCAALGLPETSKEEDVLSAIDALIKKAAPPEGMPEAEFAKAKPTFAAVLRENAELKTAKVKAEHDKRFDGYLKEAKEFKAVSGTPEAIATDLTELEEKAGKDTADKALAAFRKAEELAKAAGVTGPVGTSKDGKKKNDFESAVTKYQKDNPTASRVDAIKAVSSANPDLWSKRND